MTTQTAEQNTIPFSKLIPTFKQFVFKKNTRPALQNVYHDGQFIVATDSHIALKVDNTLIETTLKQGDLYNPKTENYADSMSYPDLIRLFPYASDKQSLLNKKNIMDILAALKEAKKIVKALPNKDVRLTFSDNTLTIYGYTTRRDEDGELLPIDPQDEYNKTLDIDWLSNLDEFSVIVNADLMIKVLSAMKKYIVSTKEDYIIMNLYSNMRPILLSSKDEKFQTLIMPIRKIK